MAVSGRSCPASAWANGAGIGRGHATSNVMTTIEDLNQLSPADHNATPWVATPDGSWTRMVGSGVNLEMPRPQKEGRQNVPADNVSAHPE
jgi:hypothetical protein